MIQIVSLFYEDSKSTPVDFLILQLSLFSDEKLYSVRSLAVPPVSGKITSSKEVAKKAQILFFMICNWNIDSRTAFVV